MLTPDEIQIFRMNSHLLWKKRTVMYPVRCPLNIKFTHQRTFCPS